MYTKIISTLILAIILGGLLSASLFVQNVKASETIYIRADGSIDPITAPISNSENTIYTLTDDINDNIVIERYNIIIDGTGHTLQGNGMESGIYVRQLSYVEIRDITIQGFNVGIELSSCSYCSIVGNTIIANEDDGIQFNDGSGYNTIFGNNIRTNGEGIDLGNSYDGIIHGNNITENHDAGIDFDEVSNNNKIYHNNFVDNGVQVEDVENTINTWDDGYPSGGNYWSDYTDLDIYSGSKQDQSSGDGKWDHPYIITNDQINQDNYPLTVPYTIILPQFPSSISCSVWSNGWRASKDEVIISGSISAVVSNADVTLTFTAPEGSAYHPTVEKKTRTDSEGKYSFTWIMDYEGRWSVKASWTGNSKRLGSESQLVNYDITSPSGMSPCIIATATYGSELSSEVQFLRGFRDNTVLATYTGRQFIEVFNSVYYSFSPGVASAIAESEISRDLMKDLLYPLMGILHVGQSVTSLLSFNPDFGIIMFCFVVSCLIGLVYLMPLTLLINIFSKTVVPAFVIRVTSFLWIGGVVSLLVAEISKIEVLIMVSGGAFVIITAALTTLVVTRMIRKHSPKIVFWAHKKLK